jgi:hypothetical protein
MRGDLAEAISLEGDVAPAEEDTPAPPAGADETMTPASDDEGPDTDTATS